MVHRLVEVNETLDIAPCDIHTGHAATFWPTRRGSRRRASQPRGVLRCQLSQAGLPTLPRCFHRAGHRPRSVPAGNGEGAEVRILAIFARGLRPQGDSQRVSSSQTALLCARGHYLRIPRSRSQRAVRSTNRSEPCWFCGTTCRLPIMRSVSTSVVGRPPCAA